MSGTLPPTASSKLSISGSYPRFQRRRLRGDPIPKPLANVRVVVMVPAIIARASRPQSRAWAALVIHAGVLQPNSTSRVHSQGSLSKAFP
eukprot:12910170-Prorocentrum_lima.AAC.1